MKNQIKLIPNEIVSIKSIEEKVPEGISSIGSETKWTQGYTGKGIIIAVLDTGCNTEHPDLSDRIVGGYNFTKEHSGDISIFSDTNGHGTHTAGIIAGSKNNKGIVGVAPKASLLILKVLNKLGGGKIESLIDAIHYSIDWRGSNGEKVRVISLSLGTKSPNKELHKAIQRAIANDISVVAASGNNGDGDMNTNEYRYPGAYEEVIVVGATDQLNQVARFSNTNEFIDLYAPGVDIYSTYLNEEYAILSGTSMAAPHVSGAIALLLEEYEEKNKTKIKEAEIFQLLLKHTKKIDTHNKTSIRALSLDEASIEDKNLTDENRVMLMRCFCEARKTQAFFTKCLDSRSTEEEREFLFELIKDSANTSNKIIEFCQNTVDNS